MCVIHCVTLVSCAAYIGQLSGRENFLYKFVLLLQELGLAIRARAGSSDFLVLSLPLLPIFPPGTAAKFEL